MARCVTGRNSKSLVHCGSGINCYRQFLSLFGVPPHICRHSEQVAHLACFLSESIRDHTGQNLNSALIAGAALLHDIAKVSCIGTSRDHAKEGGKILRSFGLEEMASLVERHIDPGPQPSDGPVGEAEILNYADKRVLHTDVVSLDARFEDLVRRYGRGIRTSEERIEAYHLQIALLEKRIFSALPFPPERLFKESIYLEEGPS